ncbi:MAG TPA: heavy-metal-associated domain-containing protein [Caldilineae bacterium]|nr:heavy-metal-associated domain-containing protein [Caldilineae bacterium]
MDTTTIELPAMYADHHVKEVRRILLALPGVEDVYASSSFHVAEITYDPDKTSPEALKTALDGAGYLEPLPIVIESDVPATEANGNQVHFRHTAAFEQTGKTVAFGQEVAATTQRPLWPCPGMGPVRATD